VTAAAATISTTFTKKREKYEPLSATDIPKEIVSSQPDSNGRYQAKLSPKR
jgi:hypothetical protein